MINRKEAACPFTVDTLIRLLLGLKAEENAESVQRRKVKEG